MAKKPKPTPPPDQPGEANNPEIAEAEAPQLGTEQEPVNEIEEIEPEPVDPLASEAGRAWLNRELERAEHDEANGPGGSGWQHNEVLRPAIVERAEFLRALVKLID